MILARHNRDGIKPVALAQLVDGFFRSRVLHKQAGEGAALNALKLLGSALRNQLVTYKKGAGMPDDLNCLLAATDDLPTLWELVWPFTFAYLGFWTTFFCRIYTEIVSTK